MKVKILIKTPPGGAKGMDNKIRPFVLNKRVVLHNVEINEDGSQIIWTIEGDPKHVMKVTRNVNMFDAIMSNVLGNKMIKKVAKKAISAEDMLVLEDMLKEHTKIEVIKGE